jgi:hypothetical protein
MKIRGRILSFLFFDFMLTLASGAQSTAKQEVTLAKLTASVEQERNCCPSAGDLILEAGASGDRTLVPYLRTLLVDPQTKHLNLLLREDRLEQEISDKAERALAKLGETDQLQKVYCAAWSERPRRMLEAIDNLKYIGGWAGIRGLQQMLDADERYKAGFQKYHQERLYHDSLLLREPPSNQALLGLPKIVPNPPDMDLPAPDPQLYNGDRQQYYRDAQKLSVVWKQWIADHQDSLSKLEPTADDIDISESTCVHMESTEPWRMTLEDLRAGVERGDPSYAIRLASESGEKSFIPYLRTLLTDDGRKLLEDRYGRDSAQYMVTKELILVLAKLGDHVELQKIYCTAMSADPTVQNVTVSDLSQVGGWFSVRIAEQYFDLAERNEMNLEARRDSHEAPSGMPYGQAKLVLRLIIHDNGISCCPSDDDDDAWKQWLTDHHNALRKLEPTGERVDFSVAACKSPIQAPAHKK